MNFLNIQLKKLCPNLIVGYSEKLSDIYKDDFARMVQMTNVGTGIDIESVLMQDICEPQQQEHIYA